METDFLYRILLLLLLAGFVAHRGYYTRKFGRADAVRTREENVWTRLAGLLGVAALAATLIYLIAPRRMAWAALPFPDWLRWTGVGLALAGFALLQWSHQALMRNWSDTPRLLVDQHLVTDGPYRWVRHPIYTAFLLILSAPLFLSANWFVGLLWIGMTAIEVASRVRYEEALLGDHFGESYREYMRKTGRLLPRL